MILIWRKNFHNHFLEWEFGKPFKNGMHKHSKPKVFLEKINIEKIFTKQQILDQNFPEYGYRSKDKPTF